MERRLKIRFWTVQCAMNMKHTKCAANTQVNFEAAGETICCLLTSNTQKIANMSSFNGFHSTKRSFIKSKHVLCVWECVRNSVRYFPIGAFPSDNFPSGHFPKAFLAAVSCNKRPRAAARTELGSCAIFKLPLGKIPLGSYHSGKCHWESNLST